MALRFDAGRLGKTERTPQGGIRVEAALTRTGVFEYKRADGSVQRELRHPDEVFNADSIATLQDAVLTDLHPSKVTAKDYRKLSIGHVRDPKREDGEQHSFIAGTVIVQDDEAVKRVDAGSRKELSCGYSCDILNTPGEYNGEKYDSVQTNIRYNHVALGPPNWGRAGKTVALRLDSSGDMVLDDKDAEKMETEKIDGIDYKVGSPEHIQALRKSRDTAQGRADGLQTELTAATARADKADGERDALKKERSDAASPEVIDGLVSARLTLRDQAVAILGKDYKFSRQDGTSKTSTEIMTEAIQKTDPTFKVDGLSEDYVRGRFDMCTKVRKDSRANVKDDIMQAQHPANQKGASKGAAERRMKSNMDRQNMAKQPLTFSKDKKS